MRSIGPCVLVVASHCLCYFVIKMPERQLRARLLDDGDEDDEEQEFQPEQGLPLATKQQLLKAVTSNGGIGLVSHSSRHLGKVCDSNPSLFGAPRGKTPRGRRKQCSNFIDKLKRRNPSPRSLRLASEKILSAEATALPSTSYIESKKRKTTEPKTTPPTAVAKVLSPLVASPTVRFASPVKKMPRRASAAKKAVSIPDGTSKKLLVCVVVSTCFAMLTLLHVITPPCRDDRV